jgi:DNA-binding MarR family transcriptional regulator
MTELWTDMQGVDPGLLGRCGWDVDDAQRDVEGLAWVGRFRFVTAQAIGERFGVSWQRANARVRRLERRGLVGCERAHVSQPRAVFLTGRGHELLGWPRRRPPRAEVQREHEAAIVALVTRLERDAGPATRVLTERECRQLEVSDRATRYSVDVLGGGQRDRRRWPDVVVELDEGRRAIEIEFAPKGTARLRQIVGAYERSQYRETVFFVKNAALGRRIARLVGRQHSALREHLGLPRNVVEVLPLPELPVEERARLSSALAG